MPDERPLVSFPGALAISLTFALLVVGLAGAVFYGCASVGDWAERQMAIARRMEMQARY